VTASVDGQSSTSAGTISVSAPAPAFGSVSVVALKKGVQVTWTMTSEGGVTSYVVMAGRLPAGPFSAVSAPVAPGAGSYSLTVNSSSKYYYLVRASLSSGGSPDSSVVKAGGSSLARR
jgi:hypothetical protein